jgi:hypothetical protein
MTISSKLTAKEKKGATVVCDMEIVDQAGNPCVKGTAAVPLP